MGDLFRIKVAALGGCLLFSSGSFAVDYFWSNGVGATGASPSAACTAAAQQQYANNPVQAYHHGEVVGIYMGLYGPKASCQYYFTWNSASGGDDLSTPYEGGVGELSRGGDSCPTGTGPYDPVTGVCPRVQTRNPGEKCEDQTGGTPSDPMIWDLTVNSCVRFTSSKGDAPCAYMAGINPSSLGTSYTVAGVLNKGGRAVAPPTFADQSLSCQVRTISSSECTINVSGAISCNVIGKLTGRANSTGNVNAADAMCPSGKCPVKEPKTETKEEGCKPVADGSGGSSCTESKKTETQGSQNCGTVNGKFKCVTRFPKSNGITIKNDITKKNMPDGSVQITTVKSATHTVCSDVNACTEKKSTTTIRSITSSVGKTKVDVSCEGTCTPDGHGLESNLNAGITKGKGGAGKGNDKGGGEEEGSDGTASATEDCAAPPPCDGDPFLCAILKQQHIDTCKLMAGPTDQERSEMQGMIDAQKSAMQANQDTMDSQVSGFISQFKSASAGAGSSGGKCLPDIKFSIFGHGLILEFSKTCDALSFLRYAVLAAAYLFAARIVIREI